jgi:hypothetical protein
MNAYAEDMHRVAVANWSTSPVAMGGLLVAADAGDPPPHELAGHRCHRGKAAVIAWHSQALSLGGGSYRQIRWPCRPGNVTSDGVVPALTAGRRTPAMSHPAA